MQAARTVGNRYGSRSGLSQQCLIHSLGVASLIWLPRSGRLQGPGITTAVFQKTKEKRSKERNKRKADLVATLVDRSLCFTLASP